MKKHSIQQCPRVPRFPSVHQRTISYFPVILRLFIREPGQKYINNRKNKLIWESLNLLYPFSFACFSFLLGKFTDADLRHNVWRARKYSNNQQVSMATIATIKAYEQLKERKSLLFIYVWIMAANIAGLSLPPSAFPRRGWSMYGLCLYLLASFTIPHTFIKVKCKAIFGNVHVQC